MKKCNYNVYIKFSKIKKIEVEAESKKEAEEMVRDMLNKTNIYKLNIPIVSRSYAICQTKKIKKKR